MPLASAAGMERMASMTDSGHRVSMAEARALLVGAPAFVKRGTVRAQRLEASMTWQAANGEELRGGAGDWVVQSADRLWTVAAGIFENRYRKCGPGVFRSQQAVAAREVRRTMIVETLEGWVTASPGDRLALGPDGDVWPIPAAEFCDKYRPAPVSSDP